MKATNRAFDALRYDFVAGQAILVDTNVWVFLHPPTAQPTSRWASVYSAVFARLLKSKAVPMADAIVLSEYLNRYLRIEYDAASRVAQYRGFKDFRRSADGRAVARRAVAEAYSILKNATLEDTSLSKIDHDAVLAGVEGGGIDYNDGILAENCRLRGWTLLTDDGDMTRGGIEVLTANQALLRKCP
jgi:predicted nucleic acid-binding protein